MKTYRNGMKATEFSKKQIGVIYREAKAGNLKIEKWIMSDLYDLADFYNFDHNGSVEFAERRIIGIIEAVFAKDLEKAQERIDNYTESTFEALSLKARKNANREILK